MDITRIPRPDDEDFLPFVVRCVLVPLGVDDRAFEFVLPIDTSVIIIIVIAGGGGGGGDAPCRGRKVS